MNEITPITRSSIGYNKCDRKTRDFTKKNLGDTTGYSFNVIFEFTSNLIIIVFWESTG
jgi:hypothetical protein